MTRGVESWEARWEESDRCRVLLVANIDHAGSLFKWCAALNTHTEIAARTVVFKLHRMGEPGVDLLYPFGRPLAYLDLAFSGLVRLLDEADVIHLKDQTGFVTGENGLPRDLLTQFGKPIVFTHYGGNARLEEREDWYREHVLSFDARVAMTPDLCFDWASDWHYIPHAIDVNRFPYAWQDGRVVAHSPSRPERKGTAEFIEALEALADLGLSVELITGMPHDACIALKRQASLFFDQAGRESPELGSLLIGWYGNSALEAAVFGIPTMAHLSEQALLGAERAGMTDIRDCCPILDCGLTAASMAATMRAYFESSSEERRRLSESTRAWIEDFHSYQAVAHQLVRLYDDLLASPRAHALPVDVVSES
jgi:glycosyltransferase involved in cell wall biosynthesis